MSNKYYIRNALGYVSFKKSDEKITKSTHIQFEDQSYKIYFVDSIENASYTLNKYIAYRLGQSINGEIGTRDYFEKNETEIRKVYKPKHVNISIKRIEMIGKGVTRVIFMDNSFQEVKCGEDDEFDIYEAVANAIAKQIYGSRHQFKKTVDNIWRKS